MRKSWLKGDKQPAQGSTASGWQLKFEHRFLLQGSHTLILQSAFNENGPYIQLFFSFL